VHPQDIAVLVLCGGGLGEPFIDGAVGGPVAGIGRDAIELIVEERPQHRIAEAFVERFGLAGRQRDRHDPVAGERGRQPCRLVGAERGCVPRPSYPE
jgi:hypothetical protein